MKLDYKNLEKQYPNAVALIKKTIGRSNNRTKLINFFDKNHVRVLPGYGASGGFSITVYRAKLKSESKGDHDWRMVREGIVQSYNTRGEAEKVGFEKAFECLELLLVKNS